MQIAVFIIFIVLVSLIGMRVWFISKSDKSISFFDAVDSILSEDDKKEKKDEDETV
jgi:steroid 5-alpha reductase family enzyme